LVQDVDGGVGRAHQHAAGAPRQPSMADRNGKRTSATWGPGGQVRRLSSKLHMRAEAVAAPGDPGHRRADERAASPTVWAATGQAGGWTTPPPDPDAIAADVGRAVDYRPVETDGAGRAAPSSPNSSERLASEADLSLGRTSLVL
jgi:hypothetical protein